MGQPVTAEASRDPYRYAAWLHELDAWTEYWDVYHPETRGRFYFGDGNGEGGLLTEFLPRERWPSTFVAWSHVALLSGGSEAFAEQVRTPRVASAVMEEDELVARIFAKHFGDPADPNVQADYLKAILLCGTDTLPPATERDQRIPDDDWRKRTAGRHMIDADLMWFAWALHLEATEVIVGADEGHERRTLQMAGVAIGCPANFTWRGHRRTRPEYVRNEQTLNLLHERGMRWALDFDAATAEVHALYRIREWGHT